MTLKKYQQKRNFTKTAEPKGVITKRDKTHTLLYLIQKHAASHLHYDFRLELNGTLLSWAVPKGPCLDPKIKRLAMHVEDHPLEYGSFEGTIPKGEYGGGTVMLWDQGTWIPEDKNPTVAYKKGDLKFRLQGKRLQGLWKLIRINKNDKTWLLIKIKDEYAKSEDKYDILTEETRSITTNRTMDEIAQKKKSPQSSRTKLKNPDIHLTESKFPSKFSPQLATLVDKPPLGNNWLHEIKFDGYRLITFKKNNQIQLFTRNNNDWTNKFKSIAAAISRLPIKNAIFDGEIVSLDKNNKSDFQQLQNAIKNGESDEIIYYIFDLPYYDKYDLTDLPLLERKNILKKILNQAEDNIRYSDHIEGSGREVFAKSCELSLEGIISKDKDSAYAQKRTKSWLKIKCIKRQEFVVGGYTEPKKTRQYFGSLLIGTYNKTGQLIYNGHVGTGFTEESLASVHSLLLKYANNTNPFKTKPPGVKNVSWVKPILIVEVEFTEWTKDNILRHPSFKGIRCDKKSKSITKELIIPVEMIAKPLGIKASSKNNYSHKLSNPDKILYPEDKFTKNDIADYYENISKWILPYIKNRPLTLLRCPSGYKNCFYQKHLTNYFPEALLGKSIQEKNKKSDVIYLEDEVGLMALPQLGVLEIHPWGSRIDDIEYPDWIVFDLDPAPDVSWKKVVKAAFDLKEHLAELKLKSFVKTTGGKGLHVVVPIKPQYDWRDVKNFSNVFVDYLVMLNPKDYIGNMSKSNRKGKIYIDYLRNQRGATAIAPYSPRARLHAPVATPVHWDELTNKFDDTFYTIKTLPKRLIHLVHDPWKDFYKIKQSLKLSQYK